MQYSNLQFGILDPIHVSKKKCYGIFIVFNNFQPKHTGSESNLYLNAINCVSNYVTLFMLSCFNRIICVRVPAKI